MLQSLEKNTLAYQLGVRPMVNKLNLTEYSLPVVVQGLVKYLVNCKTVSPEHEALRFYMMNHAVSLVRDKFHPLSDLGDHLPILEKYNEDLYHSSVRMFYYLLMICTRESRHSKTDYESKNWKDIRGTYGDEVHNFHTTIKGKGSSGAVDALKANPPNTTLGNYTSFLADVFKTCSFSSGFGGKAWYEVAKVLRDFVSGTLSAEMMMDTAFTLCHNNGPIFNKGMLFKMYSDSIYMILDVQRSGQIPQLIASKDASAKADNSDIYKQWENVRAVLGDKFDGYVDWYKVEALGSLHKYPGKKKDQDALYGTLKEFVTPTVGPIKAKDDSQVNALNGYEVMPGVFVKKVKVRA